VTVDAEAARPPLALHEHRGTRAVQRMVEHAPSTGGLALWCRHVDADAGAPAAAAAAGPGNPPVSTDGHTLFYDPAFEQLPLPAQAGAVAHGVLHVALRHGPRYLALQALIGDADLELFNVCADAIVNSSLSHLAWLQLPAQAVTLEQLLAATLGERTSAEAALAVWDVERLYRALDDRDNRSQARRDGPRSARARQLGAAAAKDLLPDEKTRGAPEDEADQIRLWSERLLRGHAGDGALSMLRTLMADLPRTRTPWEQVLRTRLARALSRRPGLSWSRPARSYLANQGWVGRRHRMPWEPGTTPSRQVARLAVLVDVSGSIDDALMERFAREVEAIARRQEAELLLVVGDDQVRQTARFDPGRTSALRDIVFTGGGNTDFTPLLEEAQRGRPDIIVFLTDLEGPARFVPSCPVIWAVPAAGASPAPKSPPFGRLLMLQ
jgi:predicted metal-dependent peptidase